MAIGFTTVPSDLEFTSLSTSTLVRVRWNVPYTDDRPFGPFPYRCRDGSLSYPMAGQGWHWKAHVAAAIGSYGEGIFEVLEAWEFVPNCDHRPFDWIPDLYQQRLNLGKDGEGRVLKFGLNSLYGKLAQTVGGGGRHADFVWAGMITAQTRARLVELATLGGEHAVMLATDAVYFDSITPELAAVRAYAANPPLGEWEYDPKKSVSYNALIVQSGLWIDGERLREPAGGDTSSKQQKRKDRTRGIGIPTLDATNGYARLYEAWLQDGPDARVHFGVDEVTAGKTVPTVFRGLRSAVHLNRLDQLATWQAVDKWVSFAPEPKRIRTRRRAGETFVRTVAAMNDESLAHLGVNAMLELSAPYRRISRKDAEKDVFYEQPDHVDGLDHLLGDEV